MKNTNSVVLIASLLGKTSKTKLSKRSNKRAPFNFYGYDLKLDEIVKLKGSDCLATSLLNSKKVSFNIYNEAHELMCKNDNVFFRKHDKTDGILYAELIPEVIKKNKELKNIHVFICGNGLLKPEAEEVVRNHFKFEKPIMKPIEGEPFDLGVMLKETTKLRKELEYKVELSKTALSLCSPGEVLTKGKQKIAIMFAYKMGDVMIDEKKLIADGLYDKYKKESNVNDRISVDDGTTDKRHKHEIYTRDMFTDEQLFDMAKTYYEDENMLNFHKKREDSLKKALIPKCQYGENKFEKNGEKIFINKNKPSKGRTIVDIDKLKTDGLYDKYKTHKANSKLFSVKEIII